jgi:nitroreductase
MSDNRIPEHTIDPLFVRRWSPRAFSGEPIDEATLLSFFEAARWAPSSNNSQPWRFIFSRRGSAEWPLFVDFLSERNQSWAHRASALVILLSKTTHLPPGETTPVPARNHSFDAGAAWASLALQSTLSGWYTHAIGGYDKVKARAVLQVPDGYNLEIAIAVGRRGDAALLSEALREREQPNPRRPLRQLVAEGKFGFADATSAGVAR